MKLELEKYEDKARWVLKGRIASHSATCSAAAGKRQIQDQKETNTGQSEFPLYTYTGLIEAPSVRPPSIVVQPLFTFMLRFSFLFQGHSNFFHNLFHHLPPLSPLSPLSPFWFAPHTNPCPGVDTQYDEPDCLLRKLLSLRLAKDNQGQAGNRVGLLFIIHLNTTNTNTNTAVFTWFEKKYTTGRLGKISTSRLTPQNRGVFRDFQPSPIQSCL